MSDAERILAPTIEAALAEAKDDRVLAELVVRPAFVAFLQGFGPRSAAALLEELEGAVLRAQGSF